MKVRLIGDVHGHLEQYVRILEGCTHSIAMGEMGFGVYVDKLSSMYKDGTIDATKHLIVPGNHDHYGKIDELAPFLVNPGYGTFDQSPFFAYSMFYVRGAASIDRGFRTQGIDWFHEEELSQVELGYAIGYYATIKPDIMITHTCPDVLVPQLLPPDAIHMHYKTEQALQAMLDIHKPKLWIFGHFHRTGVFNLPGNDKTKFLCLGELAACDLDLDTYDLIILRNLKEY